MDNWGISPFKKGFSWDYSLMAACFSIILVLGARPLSASNVGSPTEDDDIFFYLVQLSDNSSFNKPLPDDDEQFNAKDLSLDRQIQNIRGLPLTPRVRELLIRSVTRSSFSKIAFDFMAELEKAKQTGMQQKSLKLYFAGESLATGALIFRANPESIQWMQSQENLKPFIDQVNPEKKLEMASGAGPVNGAKSDQPKKL